MPGTPSTPATRPTLVWAVRLLVGQAVALAALTVFLVYQDLTASADSAGIALGVTLYCAMMALLLGWFARALSRLRSWARGPAIVLELLLVPIGLSMNTSGLWWLGLVLIAVGLGGAGTLIAPATRAALGMR
jgi:hypothetical protein